MYSSQESTKDSSDNHCSSSAEPNNCFSPLHDQEPKSFSKRGSLKSVDILPQRNPSDWNVLVIGKPFDEESHIYFVRILAYLQEVGANAYIQSHILKEIYIEFSDGGERSCEV